MKKSNFLELDSVIGTGFKDEKGFYNAVFKNNIHPWSYHPSKAVVGLLKEIKKSPRRIADIGIGDGRHTEYFLEKYPGAEIVGIDFSENAIALCQKRFSGRKNVRLVLADLAIRQAIKKLGKFDLVLEWSVANHLVRKKLRNFAKNIFNSLSPGGHLVSAQINIPQRNLFKKGTDYLLQGRHYTRSYTKKDILNLYSGLKEINTIERTLETNNPGRIFDIFMNTVLFEKNI
jgi:SAM-dependent methyltransferase